MDRAKRRTLLVLACGAGTTLLGDAARAASEVTPPDPQSGSGQPAGISTFVLRARKTSVTLAAGGAPIDAMSYDGSAAGPVLRLRRGQSLDLALSNALDEPTSLQWHGLRCPNRVDGAVGLTGPALPPGASATIRFAPPDSGLWWFHPAAVPGGRDQTALGLRGVLIVEEPDPPLSDVDHLLVMTEWMSADGTTSLAVNGSLAPERLTGLPGARVRLRALNATTWRQMVLAIEGTRPLLLAIDGQPSELFEPLRDTVPIGPGARFEFMFDLPRTTGERISVKLREIERVAGAPVPDRPLLEIETAGVPRPTLPAIAALPTNPQLPPAIPLERAVRAQVVMAPVDAGPQAGARWSVNGVASLVLPERPLVSVRQGGTVTLGLTNKGPVPIALRLHGHVMRLLHDKDDGWEPYWRDSVLLPPRSTHHVAFVADNPGRWLIESAEFGQAAFGLRHWFQVEA